MTDHRLDGGATPHLAADGFGDTANLAAGPDLKLIWIVVAAVALVAVDAARCNTSELFEVGDDGTERVAVIGLRAGKLAISKPSSPGKSILDQPLGRFFTND